MFPIELGPDPHRWDHWQARVTVHGVSVHRGGFALPYTAYHWALAQLRDLEAAA